MECKGVFGKWFGHRYQSFTLESRPSGELNLTNCFGSELEKFLDYQTEKTYEIRCKRCGCQPHDILNHKRTPLEI